MQHHIVNLRDTLKSVEDDPSLVMTLWNKPEIKMRHILETLKASAHYKDGIADEQQCITRTNEILTFINSKNWDHHCWHLHDCHFHINFEAFVSCPYTCLSEIEEVLTKMLREMYHA